MSPIIHSISLMLHNVICSEFLVAQESGAEDPAPARL